MLDIVTLVHTSKQLSFLFQHQQQPKRTGMKKLFSVFPFSSNDLWQIIKKSDRIQNGLAPSAPWALLDFNISYPTPGPHLPTTITTTTTTTTIILHIECLHEFWIVSTWNRCCKTNGCDNGVIRCDRWSTLLLWAVCFGKCSRHHLTPMGPDTWSIPVLPSSLKKKSATILPTFTRFTRRC